MTDASKGTPQEPNEPDVSTEPQDDNQNPPGGEGSDDGLTDAHGQPAISKGKYERDIKAKDDEIAALKAEVEKAAETKQGRDELNSKIASLEQKIQDERTAHALELAGCKNTKAAKALLDDYEGDVAKLKAECPYLFESEQKKGSTGYKPSGGADKYSAIDEAMGLGSKK